jgi:Spy/CpxP family protein refolding chaperone
MTQSQESLSSPSTPRPKRSRRKRIALFAGLGLGLVAIPALAMAASGGHPGHHGHLSHHSGEAPTVQQVRAHMDAVADMAFSDVTTRQRSEIDGVLDDLAPKALKMRAEGKGLHEELRDQLRADEIDRADVEALRQDMLHLVDQASKDALDGVVGILEVLSPEQRRALLDKSQARHEQMRARHEELTTHPASPPTGLRGRR